MLKLSEEQCSVIKARIAAAKDYRDTVWANSDSGSDFRDDPARWMAILRGRYWAHRTNKAGTPRRSSNQILPKLRAKHDVLTMGDTSFFIEARSEQLESVEDSATALLQNTWEIQSIDVPCDRASWDSEIYGFGVVEVGWAWERDGEQLTGERGEATLSPDAVPLVIDPDTKEMLPPPVREYETEAQAEQAARQQQLQEDQEIWGNPLKDDPFVERFSPRQLLVDPNCTCWDLHDARYAIRIRYEYVGRLKANKRLQHTKDLKGTVYSIRDDDEETYSAESITTVVRDDAALVRLYDCYMFFDYNGDGIDEFIHVIMCNEHELPLFCELNPYADDDERPIFGDNPYPFRVYPSGLVTDNDCFYPDSPIDQVADLQLAYDESWNTCNEIRRKSPRQYMYPKGTLETPDIKKLEQGVDGAMIPVDPGLINQIVPFPHTQISVDIYKNLEDIPVEIGRQLGVSPFEENIIPQKDMLAREVDAMQQAGGARASGDAERYREYREDIARCLLSLYMTFGDRTRAFKYNAPDGQRVWGQVNNADLRGRDPESVLLPMPDNSTYSVKINADSEGPKNKTYEQQLRMKLLQIIAGYAQMADPDTGQPIVNLKTALRSLLKAFDERDITAWITPDPTPEQLQQIQLAKQAQAQQQVQIQAAAVQNQQQQQADEAMLRQEAQRNETLKTLAGIIAKIPPEELQNLSSGVLPTSHEQ
ncbi:MAG: hypothetical protein ABFD83_13850 [Armatimonadota bacterium]